MTATRRHKGRGYYADGRPTPAIKRVSLYGLTDVEQRRQFTF